MAIDLLVTDETLTVVGDPIARWTDLNCTRIHNEPGPGEVTVPATPSVMELLQPGHRMVVVRDGAVWMAGPMEEPQDYTWGVSGEGEPGVGQVTVRFADDLAVPAGYITWPDPAAAWASQPSDASRTIAAAPAETVIRTLVDETCGPGALAARQIPNLVLGADGGLGADVAVTTRFEPLLDVCRRLALEGGGLGFRVRQQGAQLVFEVYQPVDRTATARFSEGLGNLRSVAYKRSAPTVTHALVAGADPDAGARTYLEVADTAAAALWWRVEKHVDGSVDTDSGGELTAAGNEELAGGSAPVELATVTVDTEDLKAGRDFDLGDLVTVALPTGVEVTDTVRSITLAATADGGEQVTTLVGSPDATSDPRVVQIVRELGRRLGRLEAR